MGHDLQEYSNEVFLSLASAGGPLGDVTVARSRELWPGPCDHFHPVVVQSKELPTSTTHGRETGAHKHQCCKRLGLCLPKSVLMKQFRRASKAQAKESTSKAWQRKPERKGQPQKL